MKEMTKTERLDTAAKSIVPKFSLSAARALITVGSLLFIVIGIWTTDVDHDHMKLRILAEVIAAVTILAWLPWRYRFHTTAILPLVWIVGLTWADHRPLPHSFGGWIGRFGYGCIFFMFIQHIWQAANRRRVVETEKLDAECAEVQEWLQILVRPQLGEGMI